MTTLSRLITETYSKNENGEFIKIPNEEILWEYLTLQDAVDFARFAVNTTKETMRFKKVVKTVGGSIDILIILPENSFWLQKELLK